MSSSSVSDKNRDGSPLTRKVGVSPAQDSIEDRLELSSQRASLLRAYAFVLALAASLLSLLLLSHGYQLGPLIPTAVIAVAVLVSETQTVRMNPHLELSVAFLPIVFAAVTLGPVSAMLVALVRFLGELRSPWEKWLIWTSSSCLVLGLASLGAGFVGSTDSLGGLLAVVVLASLIVVVGDSSIGLLTVTIRGVRNPIALFAYTVKITSFSLVLYVPVIAGLAYVYETVSPWAVVLFIGPAIAAQRFFLLYRDQKSTAAELNQAIEKLERVNLSFATALVTALDARDHYTAGHSATVAVYARDIAKQLGLTGDTQKRAHLCGLLHDIGKIGVPTGVLEKEGPLKRVERQAIENHASVGATILGRIEGYEEIAIAVRHHHERFDGTGYPEQRSGQDISVLARLVAVADAYSAMTSDRPYRTALYREEARERLEQGAGTQFDPEFVRAFVEVLERESESYAAGSDWDFEAEISKLMAQEFGRSPALMVRPA